MPPKKSAHQAPVNYKKVIEPYSIALVGLMGVGKTTVGRRLAKRLDRPFYDSDEEIETASGRSVAGYFHDHGEAAFRSGEQRVITRLLTEARTNKPIILATGGGAFIPEPTRTALLKDAVTVWLRGDFETIMERVSRKNTRPLLHVADPRARMQELMDARYPIYAKAHITVDIRNGAHIRTVNAVLRALQNYQKTQLKTHGS